MYVEFVARVCGMHEHEVKGLIDSEDELKRFRTVAGRAYGRNSAIDVETLSAGSGEALRRMDLGLYEVGGPEDRVARADEYVYTIHHGGAPPNQLRIVRIYPGELPELDKKQGEKRVIEQENKNELVALVNELKATR
jgi:hypothetical protein